MAAELTAAQAEMEVADDPDRIAETSTTARSSALRRRAAPPAAANRPMFVTGRRSVIDVLDMAITRSGPRLHPSSPREILSGLEAAVWRALPTLARSSAIRRR